MKHLPLLCLLSSFFFFVGCSSPQATKMAVEKNQVAQLKFPTALKNSMYIKSVTGAEKTNTDWSGGISDNDFFAALNTSLVEEQLSPPMSSSRFEINVKLLKKTQPLLGFDMTVTTSINYTVTDKTTGKTLLNKTIEAPYTATVSDDFGGLKRKSMANEGSIRENISRFFNELAHTKI